MSKFANQLSWTTLALVGLLGCASEPDVAVVLPVPESLTLVVNTVTLTAVGDEALLFVVVKDADGSILTDAQISWESGDPSVATVGGTGLVTAVGGGQSEVIASLEGLADTALVYVAIAPTGRVALLDGSLELSIVNLDGGDLLAPGYSAPAVREPSLDWSPDGQRLVVGGHSGAEVFDIATATVLTAEWPSGGATNIIWPRFAPSGDTVYFSAEAIPTANGWDLRRINQDGTGPQVVIPTGSKVGNDFMPDVSPDGDRLVYTADWEEENRFLLRVLHFSTGVTTTLAVEGVTPVWSPDGQRIGYQEVGVVGVVNLDGNGVVQHNLGWSKGVTFSPDGAWLVGLRNGIVQVLNIETGQVTGLPALGIGYEAVAWMP